MKWYGIPKILVNELAHTTFFLRQECSSRAFSRTSKVREKAREEGFAHTLQYIYCLCDIDSGRSTKIDFLQKIDNYDQLEIQVSCDRQIKAKYYV
jgi:hypothetical protein